MLSRVMQMRSHVRRLSQISVRLRAPMKATIMPACCPLSAGTRAASYVGPVLCSVTLAGVGLANYHRSTLVSQCETLVKNRLTGLHQEISDQYEDNLTFEWTELLRFLLPEMFYLLGAILSAFAVAIVNIQVPIYLGNLVDIVSMFTENMRGANHLAMIRTPALNLLGIYAAQGALTFVYITLLSSVGERLAANLRVRLYSNILNQEIEFFDAHRSGDIINRLTADVQDFKSSFKLCISQGLRSITQVIGSTVALFYISPKLTFLVLVSLPVVVGAGAVIGSGLRALSKAAQVQGSKATAVADEAVGNIRTVRAFAMEDKEKQLFELEVHEACLLNQELGLGIGVFQGLSNVALNGIVLGVITVGGALIARQELSAGQLMSFLVASQTIQRSLAQLSLLFGQAVRGLSACNRIMEFISLKPTISLTDGIEDQMLIEKARRADSRHTISFQNVKFSYPTRKNQVIFRDLNLDIPCGRVLAICGLSGAGKSTIAFLLERFYEVDKGCILICNRQLNSLNPSWYRQHMVGYISQEPHLFATTIKENIRYGRPDATDEEVVAAAKLANADLFISEFPLGYDTVVGERGCTVSGGQKQRIAIARALLKDPPVLVLDEATSALDAESEKLVQEALDRAMKGRTVIVIAHRLSTIKNADMIAVLAKGQVVEIGTHDDLVKKKGLYWDFIKHQQYEQDVKQGKTRPYVASSFWTSSIH